MNIDQLKQYKYDEKAERHRTRYKKKLNLQGTVFLLTIPVVGIGLFITSKDSTVSSIGAAVYFFIGGITHVCRSKGVANKPVPCGSCHKAMATTHIPFLNADDHFSLTALDSKAGIESVSVEDGRTYV